MNNVRLLLQDCAEENVPLTENSLVLISSLPYKREGNKYVEYKFLDLTIIFISYQNWDLDGYWAEAEMGRNGFDMMSINYMRR